MPTRSAKASWIGSIQEGNGEVSLKVGTYPYSSKTRFSDGEQVTTTTNPEELIGAAQAACYNMALSARLSSQGFNPERIESDCKVTLTASGIGFKISRIAIQTQVKVANLSDEEFQRHAQMAKDNCPVSNALAAVPIQLTATLIND
ncbi:MAG: OsmC family peroxiredoxin [Phototrophicaceae bacterium]